MTVNLTLVFFDAIHAASVKPINICFLDTNYADQQAFLENQFALILADVLENEPIPPGSPTFIQEDDPELYNGYCMNSGGDNPVMTGAFLQYYATQKLISDSKAFADCQIWFVNVCNNWMLRNNLPPKVKTPPVPGAYLQKIVGNITVKIAA